MHTKNRRNKSRTGTHPGPATLSTRRGFTLIELGVAVLIFTLIAGVATLAVARAQLSSAKDRFERSADAELNVLLATAATGPYDNLLDGNFIRPEACPAATHLSCPEVHGRTLTVTWDVAGVADPTGVSAENLAGVLITASTELPFGETLERERFVSAPNAGTSGTTLVRVALSGQAYQGPLYLMTAGDQVAGSAVTDSTTVLMRATVASCTSAAPCRLALRPDGSASDDDVTLDHLSVTGDGIVLDADTITETGATILPIRELHVMLLAENADGRRDWADQTGSVCLYLSIPTPTGTIEEPACNTESPERIIWRTYRPDPTTRPLLRTALPAGVAMTVLTDPAEDACTASGQTGWDDSAWVPAAVCTGWTWGTHQELRDGITGTGTPTATVRLDTNTTGAAHYSAVWTAAPAAGRPGGDLWGKPRDVPACADDPAGCTAPAGDPDAACPNGYCNSSRNSAPILLEPRRGTYRIPATAVTPGENTPFDVVVADSENENVTVTVTNAASGLTLDGETVLDGDIVATGEPGPVTIDFVFEAPGGFTSDTVELELADATGASRSVTILLTALAPAANRVIAPPATIGQNDTHTIRILVIDDAGEASSGASFTYTAPTDVTIGTPAETAPGTYIGILSAGNSAAGTNTYTISSAGASSAAANDTAPLTVTGRAANVTADADPRQQGDDGTLTASVTDHTGNPVTGAHVWFTVTTGGNGTVPIGVYPATRGCVTGGAGTCEVGLTVEQNATTGTFTVTARSGTASGTTDLVVGASIARIVAPGSEIEQGENATLTFTAYNGRNEPAAGIAFTASVTAAGADVTASGTTAADGTATLVVTSGTNTPTGTLTITVDDGARQHQIRILVVSTVASVTGPTNATRGAQYGNATVTVTAYNGQGAAVPYAVLELDPDDGLYAPDSVMTGPGGTANVAFAVSGTATLGTKTIDVTYQGTSVGSISVNVVKGIANLTTDSTLTAGAAGTIRITTTAADGELLAGRSLTLTSDDPGIVLAAATANTNFFGYADFAVTTGNVPRGTYEFNVSVDGRNIPLTVEVL